MFIHHLWHMFILNITFKVSWPVYETWLDWLKLNWLPKMSNGQMQDVLMLRLLDVDESDGATFAIQFKVSSIALLEQLEQQWLQEGQEQMHRVWGTECVHFATKMQVVP